MMTPDQAWDEVVRRRAVLEQTLNREQRRELDDLLEAWRLSHMAWIVDAGGPAAETRAREILGSQE